MPDLFTRPILAQTIGFVGVAIIVIGMQQKKYSAIVLCKISNELTSAIHYLLLGGYTGMIVNFASCFTNGVYWYRNTKGKSTLVFQIVFGTMFVVLGALSWHGPISLFVIAAKLLSSVSLGIHNPRIIRILNLISTPCWLTYNIYMGQHCRHRGRFIGHSLCPHRRPSLGHSRPCPAQCNTKFKIKIAPPLYFSCVSCYNRPKPNYNEVTYHENHKTTDRRVRFSLYCL